MSLIAVKGNREIKIDANDKQKFENTGYKVYEKANNKLKLLTKEPVKIDEAEFETLKAENEKLIKQIEEMEKSTKVVPSKKEKE